MGCSLTQNKQQMTISQREKSSNKASLIQDEPLKNIYYQQVQFEEQKQIQSAYLFNIYDKRYILLTSYIQMELFIYDIEFSLKMECDLSDIEDLNSVFTKQNFLYLQTQEYLLQLILVGVKFCLRKRFLIPEKLSNIKFLFITQYSDLHLVIKFNNRQLRSFRLQKQIFKLSQSNISYVQNKHLIISSEQLTSSQQYINIINIQNRQIVIRQLLSDFGSKLIIKKIVLVQNTDDILIEIKNIGLFLYTVNYQEKKIDKIKLLNYNIDQICIFDDNNLLNLITQMFFIRFDRQYNIISRYKVNYEQNHVCQDNEILQGLSDVKIIQNFPELFCFKQNCGLPSYQLYKLNNSNQKQEIDIRFTQCQNYQINYSYKIGRRLHLLSQNQKYLTFVIEQSLIFHNILDRSDKQMSFNKKIAFLNFSNDSNRFYVVLDDLTLCYKTQQNLKKYYQFHKKAFVISTNLPIFVITRDRQKGQVSFYSKQSKKLIFKLPAIQYSDTFDYHHQNGIILVRNEYGVVLFNLVDRKLLQNTMIRNNHKILILTKKSQLQLWSYEDKDPIFVSNIRDKVSLILQGYQEFYCLLSLNKIIIMDQNFQIREEIQYQETLQHEQDLQFDSELISVHDQIIQKNLMIRVSIQINLQGQENIILSIESRENTNN